MIFFDAAHTLINLFKVPKKDLFRLFCEDYAKIDLSHFNSELGSRESELFFQKEANNLEYFESRAFWKEYYRIGLIASGYDEQYISEALIEILRSLSKMKIEYTLVEGAVDILKYLKSKNYKIGIISNWDGSLKRVLEELGCSEYFDYVADSGVLGIEKPDKEIFLKALEDNNCKPEDAIYIGDLYYFDIKPAKELGINTILFDSIGALKGEFDCKIISNISDIKEII